MWTNQEMDINQDKEVQASKAHKKDELCRSSVSISPQNEEKEEWPYSEMRMNEEPEKDVQSNEAHTEKMVCQFSVSIPIQKEDGLKDLNISSPVKRALFWSGTKKDNIKNKRTKREKLPSVFSSSDALRYYKKKKKNQERKRDKKQNYAPDNKKKYNRKRT